jgi:hypothetical protein
LIRQPPIERDSASANALRPCASDLGHVLSRHLTLPSFAFIPSRDGCSRGGNYILHLPRQAIARSPLGWRAPGLLSTHTTPHLCWCLTLDVRHVHLPTRPSSMPASRMIISQSQLRGRVEGGVRWRDDRHLAVCWSHWRGTPSDSRLPNDRSGPRVEAALRGGCC